MKVPGKPRRPEIDFVRGVAILLVMLSHFRTPWTGHWVLDGFHEFESVAGGRGVDLFFVLSGFLVGGLLIREYRDTGTLQTWRFLVRRALKIWPAFYFYLLFHLVVRHHPPRTYFWQNFFHAQNYFQGILGQTWSLAIEEHFYLGLALVLGLAAARRWTPATILQVLAVLGVIACVWRCLYAWHGDNWAAFAYTQSRADSLIAGVLIAVVYHSMPSVYRRLTLRVWPLLVTLVLGAMWIACTSKTDARYTLGVDPAVYYLIAAAFMVLVLEHSGKWTRRWWYKAVATIGTYSYSLYLWHSTMLAVGEAVRQRYPPTTAWFLGLTLQFSGACLIAYCATHLVEWPMLRWRESIAWLRDTQALAQSPNKHSGEQEGSGRHLEGSSEAVAIG